jgi:parallel beta-helix repeat protein
MGRGAWIALILLFAESLYGAVCSDANPNDTAADDAALQACLDSGSTIVLRDGNPGYIITMTLYMKVIGTRLISETEVRAKIIAADNLIGPILWAESQNGFSIERLHFDGRKQSRMGNPCSGPSGNTIAIIDSRNFSVTNNEIENTVCGTALLANGINYRITGNLIKNGGREPTGDGRAVFADGITAGLCEQSLIEGNVLKNNTDVGIIVGGGSNCRVLNNKIRQTRAKASAGMWIYNFRCGDCGFGIHKGSLFSQNKIVSTIPNGLGAGLVVGGHISSNTLWVNNAGTISDNFISGAGVNLLVDGVRSGTIARNQLSNPAGKAGGLYFGNGCAANDNYNFTVSHGGNLVLQPGWISKSFDSMKCGIN